MLSPIKVMIVSSSIIGSFEYSVPENKYTISDDYSITAMEYNLQKNPPPDNINNILYELIKEELTKEQ